MTSPKGKSPHPRNCTLSTAICFSHRLDVRSVRSSSINSAIAYVRAPVTCAAVVIRVYTYTLRTSLSGIHSDSYCRRRRCNITVAESILYFASSRDLSSKLFREISTTLMRKHFAILFIYLFIINIAHKVVLHKIKKDKHVSKSKQSPAQIIRSITLNFTTHKDTKTKNKSQFK